MKKLIFPFALVLPLVLSLAACGQKTPDDAAPPPTTEERLAAPADLKKGEYYFRLCASCHEREKGAKHRIGPTLWGIYSMKAGTQSGFAYSPALIKAGIVWDETSLDAYIENPREFIPGTRMSFPGIKDPADRRDLIAYIESLKD